MRRVCVLSAAGAFAAGLGLAMVELLDTAGWLTLAVIGVTEVVGWAAGRGERVGPP